MGTINSLNYNEIPILVRDQEGNLALWKAWKRQLSAFHDPALWEDPQAYSRYFEPLDIAGGWGMAGYGIVVVDFKTKLVVSHNDWSTPSSLMLMADNMPLAEGDPTREALEALSRRPDMWQYASFKAYEAAGVILGKESTFRLDEALKDSDPSAFMDAMTTRRGIARMGKVTGLVTNGTFLPGGWEQRDDLGAEMPMALIEHLGMLRDAGFPPPEWESIDRKIEDSDIPLEDTGEDEEYPEILEIRERYLNLRRNWGCSSRPKPSR